MNYKLSFQERAKLGMEQLAKQKPVTIEEARAQAERLRKASQSKDKKQR
jgi:Fe-S cluster assembly ATPase SufC